MPNIVDSLFLELGIDTSKFTADQSKALAKISEFEARAKKAGKGGSAAIQSVGGAFRDLARDSSIGSSIGKIEGLSAKLTGLGQSLGVAGGIGAPLGAVTRGIGALLSPTALWGAAIAGIGAGMWDLNKVMTANNAAIDRQAQLTGTSAANMWSWAEAAKTVGANPMEISGGIVGLQTAIMGMGIGVGNATSELIGLSRLGVPFNFQTGADVETLFKRVNALAAQKKFGIGAGSQPLGALKALATQAGMNDAMWALATNPTTTPADIKKWIEGRQGASLGTTLQESLKSQTILGKLGIEKDILAETAYGGEQGLMQAVVELLTKLLELTDKGLVFLQAIAHAIPGAWKWVKDESGALLDVLTGGAPSLPHAPTTPEVAAKQARAMKFLMDRGLPAMEAAAMVGNATQESGMDPLALNPSGHRGVLQWDAARQADFARFAGYRMGAANVAPERQERDEWAFALLEPKFQKARAMMSQAHSLAEATAAFQRYDEVVFDSSGPARINAAMSALAAAANSTANTTNNSTVHHHHVRTNIGDVNVVSSASNGADMARDMRKSLASQPLLGPLATQTVTLATRGSQ